MDEPEEGRSPSQIDDAVGTKFRLSARREGQRRRKRVRVTAEILVVDDDASVRRSVVKLLIAGGYRPTAAASGAAALEHTAQLRPDLILMDLHMPRMSGIDATRALKADPALEHVPVIAMSAKPPPGELEPLFVSFLLKPMSSTELFAAIAHALRR